MSSMSDRGGEWYVTLITHEEDLRVENFLLHAPRGEVAVDGQGFESRERESGTGLVTVRGVERRQKLGFLCWFEIYKPLRAHGCRALIDVAQAGEECAALFIVRPVGQDEIDEFRHSH